MKDCDVSFSTASLPVRKVESFVSSFPAFPSVRRWIWVETQWLEGETGWIAHLSHLFSSPPPHSSDLPFCPLSSPSLPPLSLFLFPHHLLLFRLLCRLSLSSESDSFPSTPHLHSFSSALNYSSLSSSVAPSALSSLTSSPFCFFQPLHFPSFLPIFLLSHSIHLLSPSALSETHLIISGVLPQFRLLAPPDQQIMCSDVKLGLKELIFAAVAQKVAVTVNRTVVVCVGLWLEIYLLNPERVWQVFADLVVRRSAVLTLCRDRGRSLPVGVIHRRRWTQNVT